MARTVQHSTPDAANTSRSRGRVGKSYRDVASGMAVFLRELATADDGERVLILGHSATRWALDHLLSGVPLETVVTAPYIWQPGWEYSLPDDWGPEHACS